ncbi:MAG: hypothetical protein HY696_10115 [Deltaproteobacteria bacterium]|nr:hypothetical protein [Deltaproteobacteria bacterium]
MSALLVPQVVTRPSGGAVQRRRTGNLVQHAGSRGVIIYQDRADGSVHHAVIDAEWSDATADSELAGLDALSLYQTVLQMRHRRTRPQLSLWI